MKEISFTVDVEPDLRTNKYKSIIPGLLELEKLLDKYKVKPTLFVTCDCIEKYPILFKRLKNKGWEIALHGYRHERFDNLTNKQKEQAVQSSIKCFKKYLKTRPKGFRAPQHAIDEEGINVLKKFNFDYDSSIMPWNSYHILFFWKIKVKFMHHFMPMKIHKMYGLKEIPISSFIMPFSSVTLRILPKSLLNLFFYFVNLLKKPVFLMHSWDLIKIPDSKIYKLCPKEKFMPKLENLISFFSKRKKFVTLENLPPIQTRIK